jgi:hypothetical protein
MIKMKKLYNLLLLTLFLPFVASAHKHPGDVTYKKYVNDDYAVSAGASLSIANKYGKIVFHTWNNDEVKATITITGYGSTQDEAQQEANLVTIQSDHSASKVNFSTQYNPAGNGGSFWGKLFSWGNKSGKQYVNIDYDIYIPSSLAQLAIENNYGDILADDLPANTSIKLNYGNYHIGEVSKPLMLEINYSGGTVTTAGDVTMKANYSHFNSSTVNNFICKSNYSEFHLGNANSVEADGNYNDYFVQSVGNFTITSDYTDYKIGSLTGKLVAKITYGDIKISTVDDHFGGIFLSGAYANLQAGFSHNAAFRADIHLSYGTLKKDDFIFKDTNTIEKAGTTVFSGTTNNGSPQSPLIKVDGAYTDVTLHD